jgi:hypothetical protein
MVMPLSHSSRERVVDGRLKIKVVSSSRKYKPTHKVGQFVCSPYTEDVHRISLESLQFYGVHNVYHMLNKNNIVDNVASNSSITTFILFH